MSEWFNIGNIQDFPENEAVLVEQSHYGSLVVVFQNNSYYVLAGICSHEDYELDGAPVQEGQITCLLHMSSFKLDSGEVLNPPAEEPLETYETKVEDGKLFVRKNKV